MLMLHLGKRRRSAPNNSVHDSNHDKRTAVSKSSADVYTAPPNGSLSPSGVGIQRDGRTWWVGVHASKAAPRPPFYSGACAHGWYYSISSRAHLRSVITRAARQLVTDTLNARRVPLPSWTHPSCARAADACVHVASGNTVADDDSAGRSAEGTGTCGPRWRGVSLPLCQRRRRRRRPPPA
jgi:hypothetical protein